MANICYYVYCLLWRALTTATTTVERTKMICLVVLAKRAACSTPKKSDYKVVTIRNRTRLFILPFFLSRTSCVNFNEFWTSVSLRLLTLNVQRFQNKLNFFFRYNWHRCKTDLQMRFFFRYNHNGAIIGDGFEVFAH